MRDRREGGVAWRGSKGLGWGTEQGLSQGKRAPRLDHSGLIKSVFPSGLALHGSTGICAASGTPRRRTIGHPVGARVCTCGSLA